MEHVCDIELDHLSGNGLPKVCHPSITYSLPNLLSNRYLTAVMFESKHHYFLSRKYMRNERQNLLFCDGVEVQKYPFYFPLEKKYFFLSEVWLRVSTKCRLFGNLIVCFWCLWHIGDSIRNIQPKWSGNYNSLGSNGNPVNSAHTNFIVIKFMKMIPVLFQKGWWFALSATSYIGRVTWLIIVVISVMKYCLLNSSM